MAMRARLSIDEAVKRMFDPEHPFNTGLEKAHKKARGAYKGATDVKDGEAAAAVQGKILGYVEHHLKAASGLSYGGNHSELYKAATEALGAQGMSMHAAVDKAMHEGDLSEVMDALRDGLMAREQNAALQTFANYDIGTLEPDRTKAVAEMKKLNKVVVPKKAPDYLLKNNLDGLAQEAGRYHAAQREGGRRAAYGR